jgi:DNA adenine methylase
MIQIGIQPNLFTSPDVKPYPPKAKPFLKWAGGKTQLLEQITDYFPPELKTGAIKKYIEPFVGSGAVFFHVAQNYPVNKFIISDTNQELILTYLTVQQRVEPLIDYLAKLERNYHQLGQEAQQQFFYTIRTEFNHHRFDVDYSRPNVERTGQFIFLNRTCYNGLFRVNAKGGFNVPFGSYKNPQICFSQNLRATAEVLQNVENLCGDFTICQPFVDQDTFVYFDPPYRPISQTASFTSYQRVDFDDKSQIRLAHFFRELDQTGAKLMLSNSDPHNHAPQDDFFQTLFDGFRINKVLANRMINCNGDKRGKITELLITNYEP